MIAMTKGDKGRTAVILTHDEYKQKLQNCIQENAVLKNLYHFHLTVPKRIKQRTKLCNNIIPKESTQKYINMDPTATSLHIRVKIA
jgi:hypothetical protein